MSNASGIGSWPGSDVRRTVRLVRDLLGDEGLPYLPELPDRGPGADLVGRTAGMLVEMPVDLQPVGWRLVDRPGRDAGRTGALLREDLDELAEAFDGFRGELKVQVAGPWTLASSIWLTRGERVVVDLGACRDLVASLAQGLRDHLSAVAAMVPGATLVVQLDEPALPAVLAGRLPTASGFGVLRAIEPELAATGIRQVLSAAEGRATVVHCCASEVPFALLRATEPSALSLDTTLLTSRGWESVATTVESGIALWAGCVPTRPAGAAGETGPTAAQPADFRSVAEPLVTRWHEVGMPASLLDAVTVTPSCGLAGLSPAAALAAQRLATDAAKALTEAAQE